MISQVIVPGGMIRGVAARDSDSESEFESEFESESGFRIHIQSIAIPLTQ